MKVFFRKFYFMKQQDNRKWWFEKRILYNLYLIVSGIIAFLLYVILSVFLIMPYDNDFEITLFTMVFQAIGYLLMMCIANVFYTLGWLVDEKFNYEKSQKFREKLFSVGLWFSVSLPFLIPIFVVISYFVEFF